jgi:serine/threonine protein kinase
MLRGNIVFPYVEAIDLGRWFKSTLYLGVAQIREKFSSDGSGSLKERIRERAALVDALQKAQRGRERNAARDYLIEFDRENEEVLQLFQLLQSRMMVLAESLISTVAALHEQKIYHADINPQNILVERVAEMTRTRFIDFGLSCILEDPREKGKEQVFCKNFFQTKSAYQDPLANFFFPDESIETIQLYTAAFDTYSLGKVLQILFDDEMGLRTLTGYAPVIRKTDFMPLGMFSLLVDMTDENEVVYPGPFGIAETLTTEQVIVRQNRLPARPNMTAVLKRFQKIYRAWGAELSTEVDMNAKN